MHPCFLQEEQVEWDDVNKLLQRHGFKSVYFADPVENKNLSGKSQWAKFELNERVVCCLIYSCHDEILV